MKATIYLILGYGIPEDIMQDIPYRIYLTQAFNRIYSHAEYHVIKEPHIVLCGGPSGMSPSPQKTTEADEMKRWILDAMKRAKVSGWHVLTENESLSTMENLLNTKTVLEKKQVIPEELHIFCEQTRTWRVSQIAGKVFGHTGFEVHGVDFDTTPRRYRKLDDLLYYERLYCNFDLEALEDEDVKKKHHSIYAEKLERMRAVPEEEQGAAYHAWLSEVTEWLEDRYH